MPRKATKTEEEKAQYIKDKNKRYYQEHKDKFKQYYEEYKKEEKPELHSHTLYCVTLANGMKSIHSTMNLQHQYKRSWGEVVIQPLLIFSQEIPQHCMKYYENLMISYFGPENCFNKPSAGMVDITSLDECIKLLSADHQKFLDKVKEKVGIVKMDIDKISEELNN